MTRRYVRLLSVSLVCLVAASLSLSAADPRHGYFIAPKAFRAAVDKVMPSVVVIETFGGTVPGAKSKRGKMQGISRPGEGPTTGLIVSPDGYIVTSTFNFIKNPPIITVVLHDGTQKVAKLLGRDDTRKICLLKIEGVKDLPVPTFVPKSEIKVGQWAVTVGVGYGDADPAISAGIVSATSRISGRAVQTDANTSPANYGGPLVDVEGRVIGVCVPLSPGSQETAGGVEWYDSGIGFAVPLAGAEKLIAAMKEGKSIQPGKIGVQVKPADASGQGAVVTQVVAKSPAETAGIKVNDKLISIGDQKINDAAHLRTLIGQYNAGDAIKVTFERDGKPQTVEATLAAGIDQPPPPVRPTPRVTPGKSGPKPPEPKDEP